MIYADHNATTPLRPEARQAMLEAMEAGANPSSVHAAGRAARRILERARGQVAAAIGARSQDIVFTSGGTEANALALRGAVKKLGPETVLIRSAVEHDAVAANAAALGISVEIAPVTPDGVLDLDWLQRRIDGWTNPAAPLLSVMLANNETGALQPVSEAATIIESAGGKTETDAVQALGKLQVQVMDLGVDYLALSAHKCGGPQGVGALWVRPGAPLMPDLLGGGQERSLRSGTENLIGAAGFGAAAEAAVRDLDQMRRLGDLRDRMEARLKAEAGVAVFAAGAPRLPNTSCFAMAGFRAETQVMAMDLAGVAVSAGAACSSGKVKRSSVLTAMGVDDALADGAIRTSFGWSTEERDFDAVAEAWLAAAHRAGLKESA